MARHKETPSHSTFWIEDIAEDKADALAAAEAEKRRLEGEEYLPVQMADRIMAGESPLKVWRRYRGK